eukprot:COSAG06_NODE_11408_length_1514_cov_8.259144_2_plen_79_part_00
MDSWPLLPLALLPLATAAAAAAAAAAATAAASRRMRKLDPASVCLPVRVRRWLVAPSSQQSQQAHVYPSCDWSHRYDP